jgi:hypothetical protein
MHVRGSGLQEYLDCRMMGESGGKRETTPVVEKLERLNSATVLRRLTKRSCKIVNESLCLRAHGA